MGMTTDTIDWPVFTLQIFLFFYFFAGQFQEYELNSYFRNQKNCENSVAKEDRTKDKLFSM